MQPLSVLILLHHIGLFLRAAQGSLETVEEIERRRLQITTASVYAYGDDVMTVTYASDGINFQTIGSTTNWWEGVTAFLTDVTPQSRIRFTVQDNGFQGGFISSVHFAGQIYSTSLGIGSRGQFLLISSSDNELTGVYSPKTSAPWNLDSPNIADDAYWVWNENTGNTMVFEFRFCFVQGKCRYGYMDRTNGNANHWACGSSCDGGSYTDGACNCACIPNDSCQAAKSGSAPTTTTTTTTTTPSPTTSTTTASNETPTLAENPNNKGVLVTHRPTTADEAPEPNDQFVASKSNQRTVMGVGAGLLLIALFISLFF